VDAAPSAVVAKHPNACDRHGGCIAVRGSNRDRELRHHKCIVAAVGLAVAAAEPLGLMINLDIQVFLPLEEHPTGEPGRSHDGLARNGHASAAIVADAPGFAAARAARKLASSRPLGRPLGRPRTDSGVQHLAVDQHVAGRSAPRYLGSQAASDS
jgi:hypothetical protein